MPKDFNLYGRYRPVPQDELAILRSMLDAPFRAGDVVAHPDKSVPFTVAACERRVAHGVVKWVVDSLDGERFFADECAPSYLEGETA
jgi:hypothetical protein